MGGKFQPDIFLMHLARRSGCLDQVRNAPPSGVIIDDYVSLLNIFVTLFDLMTI